MRDLLGGGGRAAPDHEIPALVYARHWAECNGRPTPESRREMEAEYGAQTARAIEVVLRLIRIGNLAGNAWDEALCTLSRGRWGCGSHSRELAISSGRDPSPHDRR